MLNKPPVVSFFLVFQYSISMCTISACSEPTPSVRQAALEIKKIRLLLPSEC